MSKRCFLFLIAVLFFSSVNAGSIFKIDRLDSLLATQRKPVALLMSVDWCRYCKMQINHLKKLSTSHPFLNQFHVVVFEVNEQQTINLNGKLYGMYIQANGIYINELVLLYNAGKQEIYPKWIFLDENLTPISSYEGILANDLLNKIAEQIQY